MDGRDDPGARTGEVGARRWLRVRYACDARFEARAAWALEALMARRREPRWRLVRELDGGADVELAHDPAQWAFAQDIVPDASRDPLAATFWWLARVEELLARPDQFDEHGRFRYDASALARSGNPYATPVDDIAGEVVLPPRREDDTRREIEDARRGPAFRIVATHDIDLPWRWTRRGRRRAMRDIRDELRSGRLARALATACALVVAPIWRLRRGDPWCNATRIHAIEQRHGARSTSYVMVDARVPADGEPAMHDAGGERYVRELLAPSQRRRGAGRHGGDGIVGLHGSYTVLDAAERLRAERDMVERRAGRAVRDHRFHYLRHRPVTAWPQLDAAGITTDASLGFAEQPGFRSGTAHPYRAWDHERGRALDLIIIPLAFMDASLDERYLATGPGPEGARIVEQVVAATERVGGSSSILWHNDRIGAIDAWRWTRLYVRTLRSVRERGGAVVTAHAAAVAYRTLLPPTNS